MSHATNTDLTEEDAADLQFPKDLGGTLIASSASRAYSCHACGNDLGDPYIQCAECSNIAGGGDLPLSSVDIKKVIDDVNLCSPCFARGAEFGAHHNNHPYRVIRTDFVLFANSDWTAAEELQLLDGLLRVGSWEKVAQSLNRPLHQVVDHYLFYYAQRRGSDQLPIMPAATSVFEQPVVPYRMRIADLNDPPRCVPDSFYHSMLAGYNAARSEFEDDYDRNAESALSHVDLDVSLNNMPVEMRPTIETLLACMGQSYVHRLWERQRRYRVIRRHGLILVHKLASWQRRYETTIAPYVCDKLMRFMQFYSGEGFERLMEGFHRVGELRLQLARLVELHQKGVRTRRGAQLYARLARMQDDADNELRQLHADPALDWRLYAASAANKMIAASSQPMGGLMRRQSAPLDIVGLPSYEKLTPGERDLCQTARIVPVSYLELKDILIDAQARNGSLPLRTARKMLKIDVNKTRKLYDFLVHEGFITKPKE